MNPEIEKLINLALTDGQVTDREREIILRKAEKLGLDVDEVEMYLEGKLGLQPDNLSNEKNSSIVKKTSDKPKTPIKRTFTPKVVKHIEPAILDKEKELKLKIEELNKEKSILFEKIESLNDELKIPYDYLVDQRKIVDSQLNILNIEYSKSSKIYINNFINELNEAVSNKFGNTALIINNPERFIGLGTDEIVNLIKEEGTWDISSLKSRYEKKRVLFKILSWMGFILTLVIGNQKYNTLQDIGIEKNWGIGLSFFFCVITGMISSNFSKLINKNKTNFSSEDITSIIQKINADNFKEVEKLLLLKNQINRLEILQKDMETIKSYKKY